jgi:phage FluMu protein Com
MKNHVCTWCNKVFQQKSHYQAHLQRQKPCTPVNVIVQIHESQINILKSEVASLKQTVETLKSMIESQSKQTGTNSVSCGDGNQVNNNSNNVNNINIILKNFGEDNTSFLTSEDIQKVCSSKLYNELLLSFIEAVNCNKDVPENHNFLISNLRSNTAEVYQDGSWVIMDRKDALDKFLNNKERELSTLKTSDKLDNLPRDIRLSVEDRIDACVEDDDEESLSKRPKEVERLIYSHRDRIKETKMRSRG